MRSFCATLYITGPLAWQWLGEYVTLDKMFYELLLKQEIVAALVTSIFFFSRIAFLQEAFIRNIIMTGCINYRTVMCINNAVINNNYGNLQDLTLLFKIPMGMHKNFFKTCRQFGHMPSKRFTSPGLATLPNELSHISICIWTYKFRWQEG